MRIVAGAKRGLRLASLGQGDAAAHLRPTSDRVRESIFNMLSSGHYGDPIAGARTLDLFAGTGALGFEALSRGAAHATFVDNGSKACALIRENARLMSAAGESRLVRRDAARLGACEAPPYSLVFLDPPYGKDLGGRALASAAAGGWLAQDALVVREDSVPQDAPGFEFLDSRRWGGTYVTFLRYAAA